MLIRVGLPEDEFLELEGDIILGGRKYSWIKVYSDSEKELGVKFAVFKDSRTGKVFGRFFKRRWEIVDLVDNISTAYEKAQCIDGEYRVWVEGWGGDLRVETERGTWFVDSPLRIKNGGKIRIKNVWVGRGFHWEHKRDLEFVGDFDIYAWGKKVRAVNIIEEVDYIASVIGSELHPRVPMEALKAQALAARTNLYRTAGFHHPNEPFDICSEDHCQVYLGLDKVSHETLKVSRETEGEVITYGGELIEARYSKSCGGVMERFSVVWGGEDKPYNLNLMDGEGNGMMDLSDEEKFEEFLEEKGAFCNIEFPGIQNLYRWEVSYRRVEFEGLIGRFFEFGKFLGIGKSKRGFSGRIYSMEILTDKGSIWLNGEYFIRLVLGKPFLPSSAFKIVESRDNIVLRGMGWGHGVGMCQMGAIGMALKGYNYREIIGHYYPNTEIKKMKIT
jgi:stage II sporulation protein D